MPNLRESPDPADPPAPDAPATPEELDALDRQIDEWLQDLREDNPVIDVVERGDPGEHRWYARLIGDERGPFTIWLTLRQRSLHHETYVMPAPIERHGELYEHLLRRNARLQAMAFAIGPEDAIYLVGQVPFDEVDEARLDQLIGSVWAYVEQFFGPAMRIGYGSVFRGRRS
ncbi:MAG TPA: YbjN domain-containing protein [Acidimicrobiales bacterium]|jgi:hypothetical protein|nr:YbjN domain-containing protein [Acidimicrobiales bacterium]